MEAVALHAAAADLARQRDHLGHRGLAAMEARVEAGHLGHAGKPLGDRLDGGQVVGLVQRRQGDELAQLLEDLRRDHGRPAEPRPAVDDAVAHAEHARSAVSGAEPPREAVQRGAAVAHRGIQRLVGQDAARASLRGEARRGADAFDLSARLQGSSRPASGTRRTSGSRTRH